MLAAKYVLEKRGFTGALEVISYNSSLKHRLVALKLTKNPESRVTGKV
jgi:hypothetical protein